MEQWQVTYQPDRDKLRELGVIGADSDFVPVAIGIGATPEQARADARRRIAGWLEAISLLEEAERGSLS